MSTNHTHQRPRSTPNPVGAGESLARALLAVRRMERTLSELEEAVERRGLVERCGRPNEPLGR